MMTTVFGTYTNGQITLDEALPIKTAKAKVMVTLVEEMADTPVKPKRELGRLKGQIWTGEGFNDPLDDLKDYM